MWATALLALAALVALALGAAYYLLVLFTPHTIPRTHAEATYVSAKNLLEPLPLPSLFDPPSIFLSVIVPAYNERDRLELMLDEAVEHLIAEVRVGGRYAGRGTEIIVVDDGSRDGTAEKALGIAQKWDGRSKDVRNGAGTREGGSLRTKVDIRVVKLERNRGKGGAVRHGVLFCRGERILFADADGASKFSDLTALQAAMDRVLSAGEISPTDAVSEKIGETTQKADIEHKEGNGHANGSGAAEALSSGSKGNASTPQTPIKRHLRKLSLSMGTGLTQEEKAELRDRRRGHGVVVGSRAHLVTSEAVVKRSLVRNLLMHGFHLFLRTLGVSGVRDTQCGFKLFTRETARTLFPSMHLHRWSFDVELLLIASLLRIPIVEVPIDWHEVSGSKISIALDGLGMARDLLVLRGNLLLGRWGLPELWRSDNHGNMT